MKYTRSTFVELLAKNEEEEIVWMDGRCAPYSECWKGEYLNEERGAHEYAVEEYDLETFKKKKYKVVLDEESDLDIDDYCSLLNFVDADKLGSRFKIEDGVLIQYVGKDQDIIIPDDVVELGTNPFVKSSKFNSIKIPKTVEKISDTSFVECSTNHIEVDMDNPRYYCKDGFLIDRMSQSLIWAYAGTILPVDGSIKKIGPNAFCGRTDVREIEIPSAVCYIDDNAFYGCYWLERIKIPDSFVVDSLRICGASLVKDGDMYRLEGGEYKFFRYCPF